jgi:NAD(P)-dependent dehydrogenase (short-subunit alcohol dehydrogenase family)
MRAFEGRTAVITGAGSGIGAALARCAAARGMNLVLADINLSDVQAVAADLDGSAPLVLRVDVADADAVQTMADQAWDRFGSVDLLCNNAGVVPGGRHRNVWEYATEDWRWAFGVNLDGVVNGIRSFVPRMIAAGREGHVLNTASVAGFVSGAGSAVYGASKHAMVRVSEALYAGLADIGAPIGVTLLCPGLVATRIYDAERARPEHLRTQPRAEETAELKAISDNLYGAAPSPDVVAEMAFAGVEADQFYVFTTDRFDDPIRARLDAVLARRNPSFESLLSLSKGDVLPQGTNAT